jgi:hypothetical protein
MSTETTDPRREAMARMDEIMRQRSQLLGELIRLADEHGIPFYADYGGNNTYVPKKYLDLRQASDDPDFLDQEHGIDLDGQSWAGWRQSEFCY